MTTSAFTRAYIAMLDGLTVRVADQEGRLGTVVAMSEADPASRQPADALVQFDKGGTVQYRADRFNARLRVVSPRA